MSNHQIRLDSKMKDNVSKILMGSNFSSLQQYLEYHLTNDVNTLKKNPSKGLTFK